MPQAKEKGLMLFAFVTYLLDFFIERPGRRFATPGGDSHLIRLKGLNMIIDATKINYFKDPERSTFDQPKSRHKRNKHHSEEDIGVIIDASRTAKTRRKKVV